MDETKVLKSLSEQVREARTNLKLLKAETINSDPKEKRVKTTEEHYEREALILAKETELLSKSVPEGLPGDDGVQYFLTVAELQKNISDLRDLKQMGERILSDNTEYMKAIQKIIEERDTINRKFQSQIEEHQKEKDRVTETPTTSNSESEKEKEKIREIETKIRDTKKVYKNIRAFFAQFLNRIDPDGKNNLAQFLQVLWNAFMSGEGVDGEAPSSSSSSSSSSYVKISHLDFDVDQGEVNKLISSGIVRAHPDDPDQVKLCDFRF